MGRGGNAQPESGNGIETDETGVNLLFEDHFAVLRSVKKRLTSTSDMPGGLNKALYLPTPTTTSFVRMNFLMYKPAGVAPWLRTLQRLPIV